MCNYKQTPSRRRPIPRRRRRRRRRRRLWIWIIMHTHKRTQTLLPAYAQTTTATTTGIECIRTAFRVGASERRRRRRVCVYVAHTLENFTCERNPERTLAYVVGRNLSTFHQHCFD